jgi:hypothetical protein
MTTTRLMAFWMAGALGATLAFGATGCELITAVDRNKIALPNAFDGAAGSGGGANESDASDASDGEGDASPDDDGAADMDDGGDASLDTDDAGDDAGEAGLGDETSSDGGSDGQGALVDGALDPGPDATPIL